jgi:hypothetical protein
MTDRIVFAQDLDGLRGLAEDGSKAYVKVDGTTVKFNASGELEATASASVTATVTDGAKIATVTINGTPTDIFDKLTTLVKDGAAHTVTYANELGATTTVGAADFLSNAAGQSIIVAPDGGLYFAAVAALPDDQVLTGDNTGSITFTMTPVTMPDGTVNYTIKGVIQLATTTPSGKPNAAKLDSNNMLYVDPADAQSGLAQSINKATPAIELKDAAGNVLSTVPLVLVTNLDGTVKRGWVDLT